MADRPTKVFVGGLNWNVDNRALEAAFERFGRVTEAKIIFDRETQRSKGFGFVTFDANESPDAALEAIKNMNETELDGRRVNVRRADPERQQPGGRSFDGPPPARPDAPRDARRHSPPRGHGREPFDAPPREFDRRPPADFNGRESGRREGGFRPEPYGDREPYPDRPRRRSQSPDRRSSFADGGVMGPGGSVGGSGGDFRGKDRGQGGRGRATTSRDDRDGIVGERNKRQRREGGESSPQGSDTERKDIGGKSAYAGGVDDAAEDRIGRGAQLASSLPPNLEGLDPREQVNSLLEENARLREWYVEKETKLQQLADAQKAVVQTKALLAEQELTLASIIEEVEES